VSHFVYATKQNVPDYVLRSGIAYRIVIDQLGSVRQVINSATGEIVQRMDYDEYGNVTNFIGQQIVPMGFAGGLYDSQTGLTRFGVRDYDANIGRWTKKDPIQFHSNSTNHYSYAGNNPINNIDALGTASINWDQAVDAFTCAASITSAINDILEIWESMGRDLWRNDPVTGSKTSLAIGLYSDLWGMWGGAMNFANDMTGNKVKTVRSDPVSMFAERVGLNENGTNLTEALVAGAMVAMGYHALDLWSNGYTFRAIIWSMSLTSAIIAGGNTIIKAELSLGK
jgi:RHS repeat-associated protein